MFAKENERVVRRIYEELWNESRLDAVPEPGSAPRAAANATA